MAYLVVTIKEILDQGAFAEYAERVRPTLQKYDGWWVAIEAHHETRAGTWPYVRTVLVEFPSIRSGAAVVRFAGIPRDHSVAAARN
jgi:uncharacterized protein (DUF1330 family)